MILLLFYFYIHFCNLPQQMYCHNICVVKGNSDIGDISAALRCHNICFANGKRDIRNISARLRCHNICAIFVFFPVALNFTRPCQIVFSPRFIFMFCKVFVSHLPKMYMPSGVVTMYFFSFFVEIPIFAVFPSETTHLGRI